ncbi:MAG: FHA domain-containing protein [Spartobacteria bacterium]|nr:FHA domain-containing protein [Spartobacteria bacterium]
MAKKVWQLQRSDEPSAIYFIECSPTILGRSLGCDIVISDACISSKHLQFTLDGEALRINDLQSSSGTRINGRRLKNTSIKPLFAGKKYKLLTGNVAFDLFYATRPKAVADNKPVDVEKEEPQWFYASNEREVGPLTLVEVFEAVDCGALHPTDDFWKAGSNERWKAFEVEGLFDEVIDHRSGRAAELSMDGETIQCPYCWHRFKPEDLLFVSNHPELMGDSVLGQDEPQRFLPSRFTADGLALDAMGVVCPDMACPRCHMRIPSAYLDHDPLFMSVVGAPASGKSYFLASANWSLRTTLPHVFRVSFMDVDAVANQWLNDYEEKLFFQLNESGHQTIAKTDMTAPSLYRQVLLNGMNVALPLPGLFSLNFEQLKSQTEKGGLRSLVLYDNAGEHFQAGTDSAATPVTKHLLHAEGIIFLFDPTEDPRFRELLHRGGQQDSISGKSQRQDILLVEMISRIRKHLGMASGVKLKKPLVLGISKADLIADLLPLEGDPWIVQDGNQPAALDMDKIHRMSRLTRDLLLRYAPEITTTAENLAENVVYIPNSALGHNPSHEGVRPCDIKPQWVEVPFLYILARCGYLPYIERQRDESHA